MNGKEREKGEHMSDDQEQPKREILWEEQRGVIHLRGIREGDMIVIEATALYQARKVMTQHELDHYRYDPTPDIKTELVQQIAEAGKQLWLDVNS